MIQLGDLVRDEISGFEGVVLARQEGLYEATQCRVHPRKLDDQGNVRASCWFEADRLTLIESRAVVGFRQIAGADRCAPIGEIHE